MQAEEYASLGATKFENKDYQGAIACFDAVLQLDPTHGAALLVKGLRTIVSEIARQPKQR